MKIIVKKLTPKLWQDLENLFGEKGACGGCWCMYWRIEKSEKWEDVKGLKAKKRFKRLVDDGDVKGLLAYCDGEPVGWCTFGKRTDFSRLDRAPSLKCDDAESVCSIPCFYVKSSYRKKGVSTALLEAASKALADQGESILEGYPVKPTQAGNKNIPAAFAWTGTIPLFEKAGFKLVGSMTSAKLRHRKQL